MGSQIAQLVLIAVLILANGYFAAAEVALISARRSALRQAAEEGSRGATSAIDLMDDPSRFLAAIQVGITLLGFMASATAAVSLAGVFAGWLQNLPIKVGPGVTQGIAVFLVTLIVSYFTLVLGELAPKRLGLQRAEAVAQKVARPIGFLATVASPVIWVLSRSTDAAAWVLGVRGRGGKPGVTEEEIKLLVTEQGTLLDEEKKMIHEVFELGDTVVREIMVPRVDAVMLPDDAPLSEGLELLRTSGRSRLPVYHEDPDTVTGVLLLKDVLVPVKEGRLDEPVIGFARPPVFVPETKPILDMLSEMQETRNQLAVVVDEYGGTAGLVTTEDIVEEIVGDVTDEYDRVQRFVLELGENDWSVDGRLPVEDAQDKLGLDIPESEEYDTVAGWLLMELGHIPAPGESLSRAGYTVRVATVRRRRIMRVRVTRKGS